LATKKRVDEEYYGSICSTFVIDESGTIIKAFPDVEAEGHAKKTLEFIENYKGY